MRRKILCLRESFRRRSLRNWNRYSLLRSKRFRPDWLSRNKLSGLPWERPFNMTFGFQKSSHRAGENYFMRADNHSRWDGGVRMRVWKIGAAIVLAAWLAGCGGNSTPV